VSNNLYNILKNFNKLTENTVAPDNSAKPAEKLYESVEPQGSILSGVDRVHAKLQKQFAESDFSKMSSAIQKSGKSKESADAITAAAGREKLGPKEMTRRAVAGKKKANESMAEQLDEIGDTPAGRAALGSYIKKAHASGDAARMGSAYTPMGSEEETQARRTVQKRAGGIGQAVDRLTKPGMTENHDDWDTPDRMKPTATVEDFFHEVVRLGDGKGRDLLYFAAEEGDEPLHIVKVARQLYKKIAREAGLNPEIGSADNNEVFDLMYSWVEKNYSNSGMAEADESWHGIKDPELLQDLIADARVMDYDEFYDEYSSMFDDPEEFWSAYHVARSKKRPLKDLTTSISPEDYAAKYPNSPGLKFMNRTDLEEDDGLGAKWRRGYHASGHPAGHKHASGEIGPIGGSWQVDDSDMYQPRKKPVNKYRDERDTLAGRKSIKQFDRTQAGTPYKNPQVAVDKFKHQIRSGMKRHHGPVGVLPEDNMAESAMSEIGAELRDIYDRDDVNAFYKLFSANTPTGQFIQNMANDVVEGLGLHPKDDFEEIEQIVWGEIEDMFRNNNVLNDMNESAEDRDSYKVAKILFDQGVRYSSDKGDEIVSMIPDALRKMGFNRKIVQWYMGYDEDFISDTIGELILLGKSQGVEEGTCMECGMLENSCGCKHDMNEDYKHKGKAYGGAAQKDDDEADDEDDTPKKRGAPKKKDSERSSASLPFGGEPDSGKHKLPAHKGKTTRHTASDEPPPGTPERAEWEAKHARKEKRAKKIKESNQQLDRQFRRIMLSENFKQIMGKHHMTMDEMVKRLSHDIQSYKTHGKMSDVLRDCMEIHSHNPQIADESALGLPGSKNISQLNPGALKPPVTPWEKAKSSVASTFDTKDAWEIPVEPDHELNELARLAGLQVADESTHGEYIKQKDLEAEHSGKHTFHAFGQEFNTDEVTEDDMEEGAGTMHFKALQAKADGKDSFKMGNKEFPVELGEGTCPACDCDPCGCNEDTALNGEIEKTTGPDEVEFSLGEMVRLAGIAVEGRDYGDVKIAVSAEFDNTPEEQYMAVGVLTKGGDGEVAGKEKAMQPNKPTFKNGDNPKSPSPVKEQTDPLEALGRNLLRAYNSIKLKK